MDLFNVRNQGESITYLIVSEDEIFKLIKNINISKHMGSDGCHPRLLKETADIGKNPTLWKQAYVTAYIKTKVINIWRQIID